MRKVWVKQVLVGQRMYREQENSHPGWADHTAGHVASGRAVGRVAQDMGGWRLAGATSYRASEFF